MQCQMWVKKQLSNDISFIIVHYILIKFSKQDQMWAKKILSDNTSFIIAQNTLVDKRGC